MTLTDLSAKQRLVFDNLSEQRDSSVFLGAAIQTIIDEIQANGLAALDIVGGTPVNAVAASLVLNITGISIHGEKVTIGDEVYELNASDGITVSQEGNIPVDITSYVVKASQTLTLAVQPTSGDKMTIGTKEYTFVPVGTDTADGEISIGADLAGAKLAVVAAINGTDEFNDAHPLVTASAFTGDVCTITAKIGGTAGNSIATTETFTAETNVFGDTTLKTGDNCSAANTVTALAGSIESNSYIVSAEAGSGIVTLTSAGNGVAGNAITVAETLANGNFNSKTHLEGGVDGTVGGPGKVYFDASYLYIAIAANTATGKNWRRISVGSAY